MSQYVYGEVEINCDVRTMARVLENMVPEWKDRIKTSNSGELILGSEYERADSTYHIQVPVGSEGIVYEDFGMKKVGNKWVVALGAHSTVAGKSQRKFESELAFEIGKYKAEQLVKSLDCFDFQEEEDGDEFIITFKADADQLLDDLS